MSTTIEKGSFNGGRWRKLGYFAPMLAFLGGAPAFLLQGCDNQGLEAAQPTASVRLAASVQATNVTEVWVAVSGEGMPARRIDLAKEGERWEAHAQHVPAGRRRFHAEALDGDGQVVLQGSTEVDIVAGEAALVELRLSPTSPIVNDNAAPRVLAFVVTPPVIHPGDTVTISGKIEDDQAGPLETAWEISRGTDLVTVGDKMTFTAPEEPGELKVRLKVTDDQGAKDEEALELQVVLRPGSAEIVAQENLPPTVEAVLLDGDLSVGTSVTVEAVGVADPDGEVASVEFSSSCPGTFAARGRDLVRFTLNEEPDERRCVFTAMSTDNDGATGGARLNAPLGEQPVVERAPRVVAGVSPVSVAPGDEFTFQVEAVDSGGSTEPMPVEWTVTAAPELTTEGEILGHEASFGDGVTTSKLRYRASRCYGDDRTLTATAALQGAFGVAEATLTSKLSCIQGPGYAPPGENVEVQPMPEVRVTLVNVESEGMVTAEPIEDLVVPKGLKASTAVQLDFDGVFEEAEVCLTYDPSELESDSEHFLMHRVGDEWLDATTRRDLAAGIICGTGTSFSPWAAMAAVAPPPSLTHSNCLLHCGSDNIQCRLDGGGPACTYFYNWCADKCDGYYPLGPIGGQVINFGEVAVGSGRQFIFRRESPIGGGLLGSGKKGMRVSFDPPPNVSGTTRGDWSLPFGNSFELKLGEGQNVSVAFSPTKPGRQRAKLYKWHVLDGNPVFQEEWTILGDGVQAP